MQRGLFRIMLLSGLFAIGVVSGCEQPTEPPPSADRFDPASLMPLNRVSLFGTHNSYWALRQGGDPFAEGPGEPLLEQILSEGVRHLDLDLHKDPKPHAFSVHHAIPGDTLCSTLDECLGLLRTVQRTLPSHHPLVVMLEFKNLSSPLFDDEHTIADLDRVLTEGLGAALYRPADFLRRCPSQTTLSGCVQQAGWPTVAELRGRVLFVVMGYWHMFGGQDDIDWANYATSGDIAERAGFPLANQPDWKQWPVETQENVSEERHSKAIAQSLFLDAWDLNSPHIRSFLSQGKIIRLPEDSEQDFERNKLLGGQLVATNFPWALRPQDRTQQTVRTLDASHSDSAPTELGQRLELHGAEEDGQTVFAYTQVSDSVSDWESTITTGIDPGLSGCLLMAEDPTQTDGASVSVCTSVMPNLLGPQAARTKLEAIACPNGPSSCTTHSYFSGDGTMGGPGGILSMHVDLGATESCITIRSARLSRPDLSPIWTTLGEPRCVRGVLSHQGIARRTSSKRPDTAHFFRTTRNKQPVTGPHFRDVMVGQTRDRARLVDTSY